MSVPQANKFVMKFKAGQPVVLVVFFFFFNRKKAVCLVVGTKFGNYLYELISNFAWKILSKCPESRVIFLDV